MALVLRQIIPSVRGDVLHLAPEESISRLLYGMVGSRYRAADFSPDLYPHAQVEVSRIDLASPPTNGRKYGAIIHSHVLEHVHAPLQAVLANLHTMLLPGGIHIFQVPIEPGVYREDSTFSMSGKRRARLFNQHDHVRMFGEEDVDACLLSLFHGLTSIDVRETVGRQALVEAGVPLRSLYEWTGHTVFAFRKAPNLTLRLREFVDLRPLLKSLLAQTQSPASP